MKKYLLLWIVICFVVVFLPKAIDRFTPKIIIREVPIWKVREVIKDKIIYTPLENNIFRVEKIREAPDEAYKIEFIKEFLGGGMLWGGHDEGRDFYLTVSDVKGYKHQHPIPELRKIIEPDSIPEPPHEKGIMYYSYPQSCVSAASVGFMVSREEDR
jgi:hypothetical protein